MVQPGNELFRLIRDGQLEWLAELPGHSIAACSRARTRACGSTTASTIEGTVRLVAPTIDAATRNGLVYVSLPKGTELKAGTHCRRARS